MGALGPKTTKIWAQTMGRHKKNFGRNPEPTGTHFFADPWLIHWIFQITSEIGTQRLKK